MIKPPKIQHAKTFETVVAASGRGVVELVRLPPTGGRWIAKGRFVSQNVPCDFVGTVIAGGRGIFLDAKTDAAEGKRFQINHAFSNGREHQREFLIRMGKAGAVSGLLIEPRDARFGCYRWLPWHALSETSVAWDGSDVLWIGAGNKTGLVMFERIVEVG